MDHTAMPVDLRKKIGADAVFSNEEKIRYIDVEKVIAAKNPKLLRYLPGFVLRYIKRIVHQDDMNEFLHRTKDHYDHEFLTATIKDFRIDLLSSGLDNIPAEGGCIIVGNHPLGGIDGIAVMHEAARIRKDIRAMVNDILMNLKNLNNLMIPVNKHGTNAIQQIREIDQAFAANNCMILFPAGLVSRKQNGEVKDLEWKKSFITKAIKYQMKIVPVHVEARNSDFFYGLANLRKKLGVKANLEMFYLVNETFKQVGEPIKLKFGKPIHPGVFTKELSDHDWAQKVKEHVYAMGRGESIF